MKKHLTHSFCTLWWERVSAEKSYLLRTGLQGQRKSNLRTCGNISRRSTDLRPCVCERKRETTSSLSNQTSRDFFNADRDLHITVSVLEEVGIHRKNRNVWHHFRGIPDPPVGSAEREWNRQMYFNKVREPEVAFYSDWKLLKSFFACPADDDWHIERERVTSERNFEKIKR